MAFYKRNGGLGGGMDDRLVRLEEVGGVENGGKDSLGMKGLAEQKKGGT